jgi:hypothetical protein
MSVKPPGRLVSTAIKLVNKRERISNTVVDHVRGDVIDDGRTDVFRFFVSRRDRPNGPRYEIVLDASGRELDLAALRKRERRTVLGAPRVSIDRRALRALDATDEVTIDPTENDLVLAEGEVLPPETITVHLPRSSRATRVDLYLLADTTLSMQPVLDEVQASSRALLEALAAIGLDVAFAVGNYRDFPEETAGPAFQHQLSPTSDLGRVEAAIGDWAAGGGDDIPEGQLYALDRIARDRDGAIQWRLGAKRIIVWFGDAPGHDPVCAALTGLPADITLDSVGDVLRDLGITVIAISTTTGALGLDGDPAASATDYQAACGPAGGAAGQATSLATATGGTVLLDVEPTAIANAIIATVNAATSTINSVRLDPSDDIEDFVRNITPMVDGPFPADADHDVVFQVTFAGDVQCSNDGDQVFEGRVAVIVDGDVNDAEKRVRVTVPQCRIPVRVAGDPSAVVGRRDLGLQTTEQISVFARSPNGTLLRFVHTDSPAVPVNWTSENLGTPGGSSHARVGAAPFCAVFAPGDIAQLHDHLHALVRGTTGHLHENVSDGIAWSGWIDHGEPAGTEVAWSPGALLIDITSDVIDPNNPLFRRELLPFVWGADGLVYYRRHNGWLTAGGPGVDVASPVGAPVGPRRPRVITVVGHDRSLYLRSSSDNRAESWTWRSLGAPNAVPALSWNRRPGTVWYRFDGRDLLYTFVTDDDGRLWVNVWSGESDGAGVWADQGTPPGTTARSASSVITAMSGGREQIYAFVRGADRRLYCNWWDAANSIWIWDDLGQPANPIRSDPSAAAVGNGSATLHVFARDAANNLQMCIADAALATTSWQQLS